MPRIRSRRSATSGGAAAAADVVVSGMMSAPVSADVELCYQTFGDPDAEPLLLIMGLGGPMTWWDPALCTLLARQGFYVIRYDNRDTGRSSRSAGRVTRPMLVGAFLGRKQRAPYSISDLADDAFGLMDHLGIPAAHVVGVSMGGMIAQTMAIASGKKSGALAPAPGSSRLLSLVSIMSTTGRRTVGWQDPRLIPVLLAPRGSDRESYIAASRKVGLLIGSPGYPESVESARARAEETYDRDRKSVV